MRPALLIILVALLWVPSSAIAGCVWKWDCSTGQCRQVPICDNTFDVPPARPSEVPPMLPPSIRPIQPPMLPPLGKTTCRQAYLCDGKGQCQWQTVCE